MMSNNSFIKPKNDALYRENIFISVLLLKYEIYIVITAIWFGKCPISSGTEQAVLDLQHACGFIIVSVALAELSFIYSSFFFKIGWSLIIKAGLGLFIYLCI